MKKEIKDTRIQCPYCKIKTWGKDYRAFMRDHDRADGRRCQKAKESMRTYRVMVRTPDGERAVEPPGNVYRRKEDAQAICDSMTRMAESKGWTLTYRIEGE
jgi:hypothetical protein